MVIKTMNKGNIKSYYNDGFIGTEQTNHGNMLQVNDKVKHCAFIFVNLLESCY